MFFVHQILYGPVAFLLPTFSLFHCGTFSSLGASSCSLRAIRPLLWAHFLISASLYCLWKYTNGPLAQLLLRR